MWKWRGLVRCQTGYRRRSEQIKEAADVWIWLLFLTPTHTGKKTVSIELTFINVTSVCVAETSLKALSLGAIVLEHIWAELLFLSSSLALFTFTFVTWFRLQGDVNTHKYDRWMHKCVKHFHMQKHSLTLLSICGNKVGFGNWFGVRHMGLSQKICIASLF